MKLKSLTLSLLLGIALSSWAGNTKTTVTQVTSAVEVTADVDYVITNATPFATSGSVDIKNVEHGVVIIQKIKPSLVLKNWMKYIYINGAPAQDGVNCQVKMYNRGTIIMPYAKDIRPLTCYTEADFGGETCNNYTEGSNGGFMKSLNASTLNNNFKSFKLKRGYMVTFALGLNGWGYSRCFIADAEDLEMNLPANMSGRVSSYRIFKWWDASKAGIHDTSKACNDALNTTSCFDWGQGNASLLPDVEWVPNHIYEDWPSAATCGGVTGSCHMKTNNEPGNSADDHPQDVETVLNNWQNLMRTGMRLCSESSHDGSMNHLKTFIEEIDKRGWRCDILDLHCYWTGQFNNLDWYRSEYGKGRPIWISEWVYGSSWGNAGIFNNPPDGRDSYSTKNQQKNYDYVKPVLDILNSKDYIERYYYWNSESDCSKIYKNGQVSILGKYYASMETGLAYNKKNEYVPKVVYSAPTDIKGTYAKTSGTYTIAWNDINGDMLDSLVVECKRPGKTTYAWVGKVALKDMNAKNGSAYTFTDTPEPGINYYRVAAYPIGLKTAKYSDEVSVTISSAKGSDTFQYGKFSIANNNAVTTNFSETQAAIPAILMGLMTNTNSNLYPDNCVSMATATPFTQGFSYTPMPWQNQNKGVTTITKTEDISFMAVAPGSGEFDTLPYVAKTQAVTGTNKEHEIIFDTPFAEGTVPVVITEVQNIAARKYPYNVRIWDVTNKGFKAMVKYEEATGKDAPNSSITLSYLAVAQGKGTVLSTVESSTLIESDTIDVEEIIESETDDEITYAITYTLNNTYRNQVNKLNIYSQLADANMYGTSIIGQQVPFIVGDEQIYLDKSAMVFGELQTFNYHSAAIPIIYLYNTCIDKTSENYGKYTGMNVKRMLDGTSSTTDANTAAYADKLGWVALASQKTYDFKEITEEAHDTRIEPKDLTAIKAAQLGAKAPVKVSVTDRMMKVEAQGAYRVVNAAGAQINEKNTRLAPGLYIVTTAKGSVKVMVK